MPPLAIDLVHINESVQECLARVEADLRIMQSRQAPDSASPRSAGAGFSSDVVEAIGWAAQWMKKRLSDSANGSASSKLRHECIATRDAVWDAANTAFGVQRKNQIKGLVRQKVQEQGMSAAQAGAAVAIDLAQPVGRHPDYEHVENLSALSAMSALGVCREEVISLLKSKPIGEKISAIRFIVNAFEESELGRQVVARCWRLRDANQPAR